MACFVVLPVFFSAQFVSFLYHVAFSPVLLVFANLIFFFANYGVVNRLSWAKCRETYVGRSATARGK
jgi:hypothetical protein